MRLLRQRYGGGPGHLLVTIACLAIAGAAVIGWSQRHKDFENVLIWFAAAIVLHDLFLLPLYGLLDRATVGRLPLRAAAYVRVPALICGLVLLAVFPTVLGFGARTARHVSGVTEHGYLARWLLMTGAVFLISGFAYVLSAQRSSAAAAE
jgi:hypothetical protein